MVPIVAGLLEGAVPFALDALFGGSSGVTDAEDNYLKKLSDIVSRLKVDAGKSASDSLFYKSAMELINKKYGDQLKRISGQEAAMGSTQEQKLGTLAKVGEIRNDEDLKTLSAADRVRESLLNRAEGLDLESDKIRINRATKKQGGIGALTPVVTSGVKGLLSLLSSDDAGEN